MKKFLITIAIIVMASIVSAEIRSINIHSYKHWDVKYLYSDKGDGWNACIMSVSGNDISFSINISGNNDAEVQLYDLNADYGEWQEGSKYQMQIDNYQRWDMPAVGVDNSLFVDLTNGSSEETEIVRQFFEEISKGMILHIYEYGKDEYFYQFSLRGSKAALNAIVQKCFEHLKPFAISTPQPETETETETETEQAPVPGMDNPVPGMPSAHYDLRIEDTSVGKVMYFNGSLVQGFADDLKSHGKFDYFVIEESDGGLLGEALEAGAFLRRNGVATSLDGPCASACVELYAGGVRRYHSQSARFGIHAMAVDGDESSLAVTQSVLSARVKYFEACGVDPKIVLDSLDTPAEEIRWLSIKQAKVYGLIE